MPTSGHGILPGLVGRLIARLGWEQVPSGEGPMAMTAVRHEVLGLLGEMRRRYPEGLLGQQVANAALWAKRPTDPGDTGTWDVEDEELVAARRRHMAGRPAADRVPWPPSFQPG